MINSQIQEELTSLLLLQMEEEDLSDSSALSWGQQSQGLYYQHPTNKNSATHLELIDHCYDKL